MNSIERFAGDALRAMRAKHDRETALLHKTQTGQNLSKDEALELAADIISRLNITNDTEARLAENAIRRARWSCA